MSVSTRLRRKHSRRPLESFLRFEHLENRLLLAARIFGSGGYDTQPLYAPGELLIGLENGGAGFAEVAQMLDAIAGADWQLPEWDTVDFGDEFATVKFSNIDLMETAQQLAQSANVSYAEPNYYLSIDATIPDDPSFAQLWGMNNTGQTGGTFDADIDAAEAWDLWDVANGELPGSSQTVVGIIDTGIDYTHPDLYLNVWINQGEIPSAVLNDPNIDTDGDGLITFWDLNDPSNIGPVPSDTNGNSYIDGADVLAAWSDGVDGTTDGNNDPLTYVDDFLGWDFVNNDNDPYDDNSHGTHVAGTIGGIGNNATGVTGVNWQVQMMGLKFLSGAGSGTTLDAVSAVEYATGIGADLTNNSWGGGGFSQTLKNAIDASSLFIAAAGNSGSGFAEFPAGYDSPNIISVAATDHNDVYASFSNYGTPHVDLAAPGVSVLSSTPNGGYQSFNGTSMATPHVAGATALLLAETRRLGVPADAAYLKSVLLDSVDPIDGIPANNNIQTLTNGRLNVFTALGYLEDDPIPPGEVTDLAATASGLSTVELAWTATLDDFSDPSSGSATSYDVRYSSSPINEANWDAATQATGEPAPGAPGSIDTFTVSGLAPATSYYFALKVRDNVGNESGISSPSVFATTSLGTVIFADDIESGTGNWVATGLWNDSNFRSNSPTTAWYYGNDTTHSYNTGAAHSGTLKHSIDLTDYAEAILNFSEWSEVEPDATFDRTRVQVSDDGGSNWTTVFETHGTDNAWVDRAVDLNDYVGGVVEVGFWFDTIDNFENDFEGWYIDDVEVIAQPNGPTINVSPISGLLTDESGGTAAFSIVLSEPPTDDVTISISSNDETEGVADKSSLVFNAIDWDTPQIVTVSGIDDPVSEGAVVVDGDQIYAIVTGAAVSLDEAFEGINPPDVSVTNLDLDVAFSIDDVSLDEGDNGTKAYVFTVSKSQAGPAATVFYSTGLGTTNPATADVDYVSIPSTELTIPANQLSGTITVQVQGDPFVEPDETFTVNLSNPSSNAAIADGQGLGTILDDDFPRLSIDDVTLTEGNGTKVASFTVSLLKTHDAAISVDYFTSDDTALLSDNDYISKSGTLTIDAGDLSGTIDVTIIGDTKDEESETFFVNLTNSPDATLIDDQGVGTIDNDDAPPIQIIDNGDPGYTATGRWDYWNNQGYQGDVEEAFPGTGEDVASWTFTGLTPGLLYQVSATWTLNGNRAADAPFSVYDDSAWIFTEDVSQEVSPLPDVVVTGTNFQHLSVPVQINSGTLVVELTDDVFFIDPSQSRLNADAIRIEAIGPGVTITESSGSTDVSEDGTDDSYTVVLNAQPAAGETVTIDLGYDTNQASTVIKDNAGNTISSLEFTSADWDLPKTVEVSAINDGDVEGSQTLTISHTASSTDTSSAYYGISVPDVDVSITDNDTATVSIIANDPTAAEPSDDGQFTVTMSSVSSVATVVNYTVTGTAAGDSDYVALSGSVTVLADDPSATIDVSVLDNSVFENDETVIVTLDSTDNTSVTVDAANGTATVTITDDEAGVRVTPTTVNVNEQGPTSDSYDILLATQPISDVQITVTPDNQVNLGSGGGIPIVLTFTTLNWNQAQSVDVTAEDDAVDEGGHSSVITHSATSADAAYDGLAIDPVTANISDNDAPPVQIIDNGDPGFTTTGSWILYPGQGHLNDVHEGYSGGPVDTALWTFTGLNVGQLYQVSATWTRHGNRSTDAPYRILDDTTERHFQRVNQELDPQADATELWGTGQSTNFEHLGAPVLINSGTLIVELTDDADERLNADAIRIEAVGPRVTVTQTGDSTDVAEDGATDSYTVSLETVPTSPVDITVTADPQQILLSLDNDVFTGSVTLSNLSDQTPQTIYVQAFDDSQIEGNHSSTITHAVSSVGSDYDGTSIDPVTANITDNDSATPVFQIEHGVITVGVGGTTVNLDNTYLSPVVITTPNYGSAGVPAVSRLSNVIGDSFDVQLVNPGGASVAGSIHYIVVEEGDFIVDGTSVEAFKFTSSVTDENNSWSGESRTYVNSYAAPVVLGQVMTSNDPDWSVFWSRGSSRTAPPSASSLFVGKHVGEDPDTVRATETIGYLVIEGTSGTLNGIEFEAGLGSDIVRGVTNSSSGYTYALDTISSPDTAIVTQAAMDGGDGSWAVLFGDTPLGTSSILVAVDEDQLANDERAHTTEQLAYFVLKDNAVALPTVSIGDAVAVSEGDVGTVTASFDVTLTALPTSGTAIVDYTTLDGTANAEGDYASQNGTLTFNSTTGLTQTIVIVVNGDEIDEGINETFNVRLSNPVDATINSDTGQGTITDDDTAGVTISQTNVALDEGDVLVAAYTVGLDSEPTANVTITFDGGNQINDPPNLVFTPSTWDTPQSVSVAATDDDVAEGVHFGNISHSANSIDGFYDPIPILSVSATITDNDVAGVSISPTDTTDVAEGGTTDNYFVVLDSEPTANVTITIDGGTQLNDPPALIFTPGNWDQSQEVTVAAVDDDTDEGTHSGTLTHTASSTDSNYNGGNVSIDDVDANITDDDTAGVTITPTDTTDVAEGGDTDNYFVVLNSKPTADVTITIDGGTQLNDPPALTFTPGNWDQSQEVTVSAVDDTDTEANPHPGVLTHTASSADVKYDGVLSIANINASITDNDFPGVTVSQTTIAVTEGASAVSYSVVLNTVPTDVVNITVTPDNQVNLGSGGGIPIVLTFDPNDTLDPQIVNVTAVNDDVVEGNHSSLITHSAESNDSNYNGANISIDSVTANINDDDSAEFTVSNESGNEDGGPITFSVTLSKQVDVATSVNVSTSDGTALLTDSDYTQVSGLTLNFAPLQTVQTFTVTPTTDNKVETNETFSVGLSNVVDGGRSVTASSVAGTGTILNDDSAEFIVSAAAAGDENAGPITFTVTLTNQVDVATSVDVSTGNGTALLSDSDYTQVSGLTLNFAAEDTVETFDVLPTADNKVESNETFIVSLGTVTDGGRNVTASSATGTGTIINDDTAEFTISSESGDEDDGPITFTVTLTNPVDTATSVVVSTADDTALLSDNDYTQVAGLPLNFAAQETSKTFTVSPTADDVVEANEDFLVNLSGVNDGGHGGNVTASALAGTGTIVNDDTKGVTVNKTEVFVNEEGPTSEIYTVVLTSQPTGGDVTVAITHNSEQVTVSTTSLTFDSFDWSIPKDVTVTAFDDLVDEGGSHTSLITHTASGADYGGVTVDDVTANITDNDAPPAPQVQIIDNDDPGFTKTGTWNLYTNQGYLGDVHEAFPNGQEDIASWTFTDLPPGQYQVSATWTLNGNRAPDAPYSILDDSTWIRTVDVNQEINPQGNAVHSGTPFQHLGGPVTINSGTLVVELSDDVDGTDGTQNRLNADAIRIERIPLSGPRLEVGNVVDTQGPDDWAEWQTVTLPHDYTSMVVVATVEYGGNNVPMVARVDNAVGNTFDVRVVRPDGSAVPAGVSVHYLVVEEGVYTQAVDGIQMEAIRFNSTITDRKGSWGGQLRGYFNSYTSPVVVGQVMTANDDWSVFWARGSNKGSAPSASTLYVGKHVAEDPDTSRLNETVGYVVIETGSGSVPGYDYQAAVGSDSVKNSTNNPAGYSYSLDNVLTTPTTAIVSSAAMDGNDGAWPVLYGSTPLTSAALNLIVDEDQLRDAERSHTTEQVAYLVFASTASQSTAQTSPLVAQNLSGTSSTEATTSADSSRDVDSSVESVSAKKKDSSISSNSTSTSTSIRSFARGIDSNDHTKHIDEALLELLFNNKLF